MGSNDPEDGAGAVAKAGELLVESAQLLAGLVTIILRAIRTALEQASEPSEPSEPDEFAEPATPGFLMLIPGAAVALALEAQRRALQAAMAIDEQLSPVVRRVMRVRIISEPVEAARRSLENLSTRGVKEQEHAVAETHSLIERVLPELVRAVLDRIDIDDIVARVDLDRIIDRIDIDRVLERVDLDAVVRRISIDDILASVDVDGVIARVDIDAVIKRVDLAGLTSEVITEVDLREIVRESSSSITGEAV